MSLIKNIVAGILESKKLVATIAGILIAIVSPLFNKVGWDIDQSQVEHVLLLLGSYVVGQGIADAGKEKAKLEIAANPKKAK